MFKKPACLILIALLAVGFQVSARQNFLRRNNSYTDTLPVNRVFANPEAFYLKLHPQLKQRISKRLLLDQLVLLARAYKIMPGTPPSTITRNGKIITETYNSTSSQTSVVSTLNEGGLITGFYFLHRDDEVPFYDTRQSMLRTDSAFRIITAQLQKQNPNAVYNMLAAQARTQVNATEFAQYATKALALYFTPTSPAPFLIRSENGTNHYIIGENELVVAATDSGKINKLYVLNFTYEGAGKKLIPTDNPLKNSLDSIVHSFIASKLLSYGSAGISVGVSVNGRHSFYNYGNKGLLKTALPDSLTAYDVGSITQTFTATVLSMAALQQQLRLQAPVAGYLKAGTQVKKALGLITLASLLNHTSGLPALPGNLKQYITSPSDPYSDYGSEALLAYISTLKPSANKKPGYSFSSLNAAIAALAFENATGKDVQQVIQDSIANKLKFSVLTFYPLGVPRNMQANGQDEDMNPWDYWDMGALTYSSGLKLNSADMLRWGDIQLTTANNLLGRSIRLTHVQTYHNSYLSTGLGWLITGKGILYAQGETGGYRSLLAVNPATGVVVSIQANAKNIAYGLQLQLLQAIEAITKSQTYTSPPR